MEYKYLFEDEVILFERLNQIKTIGIIEVDDRVVRNERKGLHARPAEELARDHKHLHVRPAESAAGGPVKEGFGVLGEDDGDFHRSLLNT